jgi:hypothetical protein
MFGDRQNIAMTIAEIVERKSELNKLFRFLRKRQLGGSSRLSTCRQPKKAKGLQPLAFFQIRSLA